MVDQNICSSTRIHVANVINFEKKKKKKKLHQDATACYICGKRLSKRCSTDENFRIVRDYCHLISK